jgi:predicted Zn-dependent protease
MRHSARLIGLLLPLLMIAGACATMDMGQINIISPAQEVEMGKNLSAEVEKEQPILDNPALTSYVNEVGQRVARESGRTDVQYSFKIVDNDKDINAFALPGGPIYVNSALLRSADNEAELAGVLGHEIGHVAARHSTEQLTKEFGFSLITQVLLGKDPSAATKAASNIASSLGMLKFSRNDEIEADRLSVHYMYRAGYDPNAMMSFLTKLGQLQSAQSSRVLNLLSTHPMSQDRLNAVKAEISGLPQGKQVGFFADRYKEVVNRELK